MSFEIFHGFPAIAQIWFLFVLITFRMDNIEVPPTRENIEVPPTSEDMPAAHGKHLLFYALERKKKIVQEAYSEPNMVHTTAQKWRVQPNQICKWSRNIMTDQVRPAYLYPRTIEERTIVKDHKKSQDKE
jgi:hypothetical protein